jgi:hypothetical protein
MGGVNMTFGRFLIFGAKKCPKSEANHPAFTSRDAIV